MGVAHFAPDDDRCIYAHKSAISEQIVRPAFAPLNPRPNPLTAFMTPAYGSSDPDSSSHRISL